MAKIFYPVGFAVMCSALETEDKPTQSNERWQMEIFPTTGIAVIYNLYENDLTLRDS